MPLTYRPAVEDDYAAIGALQEEVHKHTIFDQYDEALLDALNAHWAAFIARLEKGEKTVADSIKEWVDKGKVKYFVCEDGDTIVATGNYIHYKHIPQAVNLDNREGPYVKEILIHPDYQRKGVGTQLLGMIEEHAKAQGDRTIQALATPNAVSFYMKNGYSRGEIRQVSLQFSPVKFDETHMTKVLNKKLERDLGAARANT